MNFQAKIEAFLAECHTTIQQIEPELRDVELVREVNILHARTGELEKEAEAVVEAMIGELTQRMIGVRTDALSRFTGVPIRLSLESRNSEPLHSLDELQERIASFTANVSQTNEPSD